MAKNMLIIADRLTRGIHTPSAPLQSQFMSIVSATLITLKQYRAAKVKSHSTGRPEIPAGGDQLERL